ncbi:MAG: sulfotransferase domain-containing protein [Anaerolineales bacterium]
MNQPLIISAGMPRAGSGWYYNLVHDLVVKGGGQNARQIRSQYYLQPVLTAVNCNISTLSFFRFIPVLIPARLGNKFVIKTHAGPNQITRLLLNYKWISVVYIYRDPRAALLSAYEYGQRATANNRPNAFSHLNTLDKAAQFIKFYVNIWDAWSRITDVLIVRYEDLLSGYLEEIEQTMHFLDLELTRAEGEKVYEQYHPGKGDPEQIGTHFSQGEAERFRRVFSPSQLEKYTDMFEPALLRMGYEK